MKIQENADKSVPELFDQCAKIQERLNEAQVTTTKLISTASGTKAKARSKDIYLNGLICKLEAILKDVDNLARQL